MKRSLNKSQPADAHVLDDTGRLSQAWSEYMKSHEAAVGDYRATVTDPGGGWLLCNGASVATADYPSLSALIKPITGAGGTAGTFKLPSIGSVFDVASPGPGGPPILQYFVKAR